MEENKEEAILLEKEETTSNNNRTYGKDEDQVDPDGEILEELRENDKEILEELTSKEFWDRKLKHHAHQIKMKQDRTRKINRRKNKSIKRTRMFNLLHLT